MEQVLERVEPARVGMCERRLQRLERFFQHHPTLAGSVSAVVRRGKLCSASAHGKRNIAAGTPMTEDTIFRIFSMSKIVTSVAVLQLYEQGLFQLDDPLHAFLPKFQATTVNKTRDGKIDTEPQRQPITIRHLLTHTSGLSYGIFSDSPVDKAYLEAGISLNTLQGASLDKFADAVAAMPLKFQPGEGFEYSVATDVLGRLVEVLSGTSLSEYLRKHIFQPLEMRNSGFMLSSQQNARLATMYEMGGDGLQECESFLGVPMAAPVDALPPFLSGGGGLFSTVPDFLRFSLMLAGKGYFVGSQVLGRRTVELMTQNHLPGGRDIASLGGSLPDFVHMKGLGFGLGVAVVLNNQFGYHCNNGSYFWQGVGSTYHFHDPTEDLTVVAMAQHMPCFSKEVFAIRAAVVSLSEQAIVD